MSKDSNLYQDSVRHLSDLRIVHFQQPSWANLPDYTKDMARESMVELESPSFQLQRFANAFFRYLHTHDVCRQLKALVIGSVVDVKKLDLEENQLYRPQHCYVKGLQTDILGRSTVVAVPVTRAQLRYAEPYADIVDYDPESTWFGGAAVRINEL
jgi:hypothetical protein